MIRLRGGGLLAGLLAWCLWGATVPVLGQDTFNMDFNYGFFDGEAPQEDPTDAQLSALLCETQVWISQVLKNGTGSPFITLKARDIGYTRTNDPNTTFSMTFTGEINMADGSELPPRDTITTLLNPVLNSNIDVQAYIETYIRGATPLDGSDNYFQSVDSMDFFGEYGPARAGALAEADCAQTPAPTGPNGTTIGDGLGGGDNPGAAVNGTDGTGDPLGNGTDPNGSGLGGDGGPVGDGNGTDPNAGDNGGGPGDGGIGGDIPTSGNGTFPNGTISPDSNETYPPDGTGTFSPSPEGSAPNTDNMVYFTLEYGFGQQEGSQNEREPTREEIVDLICRTNLFFRDVMRGDIMLNETDPSRNATYIYDPSLQSEAMYVDWSYTPGIFQPIKINFVSNTSSGETGEEIPAQQVFNAMEVSEPEIVHYIREYVWSTEEASVFQGIVNVNFTTKTDVEVPLGQIQTVDCHETPSPTNAPTVSAAPTTSPAPTLSPTVSPAPTTSFAPSVAPSISPAPTTTPPFAPTTPTTSVGGEGGPGQPTLAALPTVSPRPTVSPQPTNAPTVSAAPTTSPAPTGTVQKQPLSFKFIVSNIQGLTTEEQLNNNGLASSWTAFTDELVKNITAQDGRRLLRQEGFQRRRLDVTLEPDSASVDSVQPTECTQPAHQDATCNDVTASYVLLLQDEEDPTATTQRFNSSTGTAITDGTYQDVIYANDSNSPLFIGVYPPPSGDRDVGGDDDGGDDKMPLWLLILIILLCVLCCLCLLCALFFLIMKNKKEDKELDPYDEEGFVYDFLIPPNQKPQTEVDDDAETKDVEDDADEEFEDEAADRAMNVGDHDSDPVVVMPEDVLDDDDEQFKDEAEPEEDDEPRLLEPAHDEDPNLIEVDDHQESPREDSAGADDSEEPALAAKDDDDSDASGEQGEEEQWQDEESAPPVENAESSEEASGEAEEAEEGWDDEKGVDVEPDAAGGGEEWDEEGDKEDAFEEGEAGGDEGWDSDEKESGAQEDEDWNDEDSN